jgi:hypothetical protein
MTLLMAELLIVHSRNVPASVSAPQGVDKKRVCKPCKLHTPKRGARKRRNHNTSTSDTHGNNDERSRLPTRKADYKAAALVFFLVTFSKVKKLPGAGRNPASLVRAARDGRNA